MPNNYLKIFKDHWFIFIPKNHTFSQQLLQKLRMKFAPLRSQTLLENRKQINLVFDQWGSERGGQTISHLCGWKRAPGTFVFYAYFKKQLAWSCATQWDQFLRIRGDQLKVRFQRNDFDQNPRAHANQKTISHAHIPFSHSLRRFKQSQLVCVRVATRRRSQSLIMVRR